MTPIAAMPIFARVVEEQSFSAAALALGLSKAAVSKNIARLEAHLGARLLNRTTRTLSLTEAGRTFYEGCQRALAEAEMAEQAVGDLAAGPRGSLRISAPMSFGQRHFMPAVADFMKLYPDIDLGLELTDRKVDLVEEGFDFALRIGEMPDSSLIARRLTSSRFAVVASPGYLMQRSPPSRPADLRDHLCLLYSYTGRPDIWRFDRNGSRRRVKVSGRLMTNNGDALLAASLAGLGIAHLPTFIVAEALADGGLIQLLPEWHLARTTAINLLYPARRHLLAKHRVFIDFLAARFSDPPPWDL